MPIIAIRANKNGGKNGIKFTGYIGQKPRDRKTQEKFSRCFSKSWCKTRKNTQSKKIIW